MFATRKRVIGRYDLPSYTVRENESTRPAAVQTVTPRATSPPRHFCYYILCSVHDSVETEDRQLSQVTSQMTSQHTGGVPDVHRCEMGQTHNVRRSGAAGAAANQRPPLAEAQAIRGAAVSTCEHAASIRGPSSKFAPVRCTSPVALHLLTQYQSAPRLPSCEQCDTATTRHGGRQRGVCGGAWWLQRCGHQWPWAPPPGTQCWWSRSTRPIASAPMQKRERQMARSMKLLHPLKTRGMHSAAPSST